MYTKFENMEVPRTTKLEGTYFTTGNMFSGSILPDGKIWELERTFDQFEAERRYLSFGHFNTTTNIYELTFEGGFKRRWKLGEGWLV